MSEKRVAVDVDDKTWQKFRGYAVMEGKTVARKLAELVEKEVQRRGTPRR